MSDPVAVVRADPRGMITLRADLSSGKVKAVVKSVCGQGMPVSGQMLGDGARGVAWMSPDELLVMVPYGDVADAVAQIEAALAGTHFMAVDVSDARAVFTLRGPDAREVLARLCPVDVHADSFGVGQFRRTRMAQIAAAFWCHEAGFDVVCFRSVGDYAEALLGNAAGGGKIGALGGETR